MPLHYLSEMAAAHSLAAAKFKSIVFVSKVTLGIYNQQGFALDKTPNCLWVTYLIAFVTCLEIPSPAEIASYEFIANYNSCLKLSEGEAFLPLA